MILCWHMRLLVRLLETRLVEVLRFQRGQAGIPIVATPFLPFSLSLLVQVYSVSVGTDMSLAPPQMGRPRCGTLSTSAPRSKSRICDAGERAGALIAGISFECDPTESDELVAATREAALLWFRITLLRFNVSTFQHFKISTCRVKRG